MIENLVGTVLCIDLETNYCTLKTEEYGSVRFVLPENTLEVAKKCFIEDKQLFLMGNMIDGNFTPTGATYLD